MQPEFWKEKWEKKEIGFHKDSAHPMLEEHLPDFELAASAHIFLPLCGKTVDIDWLLDQGFRVSGIELVESAVRELFERLELEPTISKRGSLTLYSAENINIYVGDVFALGASDLDTIDLIYDRASLVALPLETRSKYAAHLQDITGKASQLLITFDYDQAAMDGPPFSIPRRELSALYGEEYDLTCLERSQVSGQFSLDSPVHELAWQMS